MNEQSTEWAKEREAIKARLEAATSNWADKGGDAFGVTVDNQCLLASRYMLGPDLIHFRFKADRALVVHAPEDLRRLLDHAEEDEREITARDQRISELESELAAARGKSEPS